MTDLKISTEAEPLARALVKAIAMDIAKEVVHHIKIMYPQAIKACPTTFPVSVRGCVYNEIMAALDVNEEGQIRLRLAHRKRFRRQMTKAYSQLRNPDGHKKAQ